MKKSKALTVTQKNWQKSSIMNKIIQSSSRHNYHVKRLSIFHQTLAHRTLHIRCVWWWWYMPIIQLTHGHNILFRHKIYITKRNNCSPFGILIENCSIFFNCSCSAVQTKHFLQNIHFLRCWWMHSGHLIYSETTKICQKQWNGNKITGKRKW